MAFGLVDGTSFVAALGGTGTFNFGSARSSFLTLTQALANGTLVNGQTVDYVAVDNPYGPSQREWGRGTYSSSGSGSIARTTVFGGTAGVGTAVNFSTPPTVSLDALAEDLSVANASQNFVILGASAVAISTSATSETNLATVTVPPGAMGANGTLRVTSQWSFTGSTNQKLPKVRFGASAGIVGTAAFAPTINTATQLSYRQQSEGHNRNSASSQIWNPTASGGWSAGAGAPLASANNTANATYVNITGQLAVGTETLTLESYLVELLYGP